MAAKSASLIFSPSGTSSGRRGLDAEADLGRRRADELDNGADVGEGATSPVDRDEAEQAVLDLYLHQSRADLLRTTASTVATCRRSGLGSHG